MNITTFLAHLLLAFFLLIAACSSAQIEDIHTKTDAVFDPDKVLIVYLSRTNNTKAIAEMIHEKVGGKLVSLELEIPYPEDYDAIVNQVAEENENGFLPPLKTKIEMDKYDTIFLGFPTWGMRLPPPMKSFLHQYDLSGKTVIPFNTNAGYGVGSSFETVEEMCPDANIMERFSIKGGIERDGILFVMQGKKAEEAEKEVTKWLQKIEVIK
ncbi:flavodoxin [Catalinimonas alkaloidigena]|uniref:flavodoxin family protein n=1 Tax=Catalinimonas alkaloidigena TaxID=1075417 RepID=UPI002407701D|nr:flavodoxin [Catalinimonas alkaloidigena]MDF9801275.1 flavodoxin [Catalinimonas alkaloidigena]